MKDILKARPVESALLEAASSRAFVRQLVIESVLNENIADAIKENFFDKLSDEDKADIIYATVEAVERDSSGKNGKNKLLNSNFDIKTLSFRIDNAETVDDKYDTVYTSLNDKGKSILFNSIAAKLKKDSFSDVQSGSNEDKKSDVIEKRLINIVKTALKDDIEKIEQLELNSRQKEQLLNHIKEQAEGVDDNILSDKNGFIDKITYIVSRCSDFDKAESSIQNFLNKIDDDNKAERRRASAQRFLADFDYDKDLVQKVHDEVNFDDAQNAEYSKLTSLEEKLAYLLKYIDEERVQSIKDEILSDRDDAKPSEKSSEETTAEAPKMADDAAVKAAMGKISDKLSAPDQLMAYRLIQDYVEGTSKFKEDEFKAKENSEEQHKYLLKLLKADEIKKICDDCIKRVQSSGMPSRPSSKEEDGSNKLSMMQKIQKFFKDKAGKKQYDKTSKDAFQKFLKALRTARADYDDKELLETQIAVYVNKHLFPCSSIEASGTEVKKDKTIGFVVDLKQKDRPLTLGKLHEALNSDSNDKLFLKDKKFSQMFEHMALFTKNYSEKAVKWYLENAGLCISDASFLGIKNVMILANRVDRVRMYKFNGKSTLTFILDSIDLKKQFNKAFSE